MKKWTRENKDNLMIVIEIIVGLFLMCMIVYAISLFGKTFGYETIKNDTYIESLEVKNKDTDTIFTWNGKAYSTSTKYILFVNYEDEEYSIKVNRNVFGEVEIGDYVECVINVKEKENGRRRVSIGLNYKK